MSLVSGDYHENTPSHNVVTNNHNRLRRFELVALRNNTSLEEMESKLGPLVVAKTADEVKLAGKPTSVSSGAANELKYGNTGTKPVATGFNKTTDEGDFNYSAPAKVGW